MNVTQIRCTGCGAPISISRGARIATCRFCNASLSVEQTESGGATSTGQPQDSLKTGWRRSKRRRGNPSFLSAIFSLFLGVPLGLFWISGAIMAGSHPVFVALGAIFLVIVTITATRSLLNAGKHPTA